MYKPTLNCFFECMSDIHQQKEKKKKKKKEKKKKTETKPKRKRVFGKKLKGL